jgi:hypothetical protein
MLLVCRRCTTAYAVGLPRCPNCTATDHYRQGEEVPVAKIHVGRPPTYSPAADTQLAPRTPPAPPVEDYRVRSVAELRQLIRDRNEDRPEPMPLSGSKAALAARLAEDDRLRRLVGG